MSTARTERATVAELRAAINKSVGQPVIINLSDFDSVGDVVVCTMVVESAPEAKRWKRTCEGPECGIEFWAESPKAQFHTANCKLRAFRARQRAEAQELLDAAAEAQANSRLARDGVVFVADEAQA